MAKFLRGKEASAEAEKKGGSGKFTPFISWKDGEKKVVQFVTPYEESPFILYHNFIIVGHKDGKPVFDNFISPRTPGINESDPIWDRFDRAPAKRRVAVAVELEPAYKLEKGRNVIKGVKVATRTYETKEGKTVEVPKSGLVVQAESNFFGYLKSWHEDTGPIEETIFSIKRRGGDKDTNYDFAPVQGIDVVSLDGIECPDMDAWLDEMSDIDRLHRLIDPLPDGWKISQYASGGTKKEDEPAETPADEVAEAMGAAEPSSKFGAMRAKAAAAKS